MTLETVETKVVDWALHVEHVAKIGLGSLAGLSVHGLLNHFMSWL